MIILLHFAQHFFSFLFQAITLNRKRSWNHFLNWQIVNCEELQPSWEAAQEQPSCRRGSHENVSRKEDKGLKQVNECCSYVLRLLSKCKAINALSQQTEGRNKWNKREHKLKHDWNWVKGPWCNGLNSRLAIFLLTIWYCWQTLYYLPIFINIWSEIINTITTGVRHRSDNNTFIQAEDTLKHSQGSHLMSLTQFQNFSWLFQELAWHFYDFAQPINTDFSQLTLP